METRKFKLHQRCKLCQVKRLIINFKTNKTTGLKGSLCYDCISYFEAKHMINRRHYFNPSIYKEVCK